MIKNPVAILGAGNMGTALAVVAAKNAPVTLWSVEPDVVEAINRHRTNPRYVPEITLPENIRATGALEDAVRGARLIVVSVPSHVVPSLASMLAPIVEPGQYVMSAAKGLEEGSLRTVAEALRDALPERMRRAVATMSGPSIANEFAAGLPCAVTVAAADTETAERVADFFRTDAFRVLASADFRGTALGGTLKNIYALALGMADGLKLGMNAKAALLTASLHELARLMEALGARAESAYALSGVGDLVVTGMSEHSRNRGFGELLCLDPACRETMHDPARTIEGVKATAALGDFVQEKNLSLPIFEAVRQVLFENVPPAAAITRVFSLSF